MAVFCHSGVIGQGRYCFADPPPRWRSRVPDGAWGSLPRAPPLLRNAGLASETGTILPHVSRQENVFPHGNARRRPPMGFYCVPGAFWERSVRIEKSPGEHSGGCSMSGAFMPIPSRFTALISGSIAGYRVTGLFMPSDQYRHDQARRQER